MTKAEAIEVLKSNYPDPCYSLLREAVDMAIEALEKQTAKKPIEITRNVHSTEIIIRYDCPTCHKDVTGSGFHCWNCGQALDWDATIRREKTDDR